MTFGLRWSQLDERLAVHEDLFVVLPPTDAGTRITVDDSFATSNEFVGGELGFIVDWERRRWSLELLSRIAIGTTRQRVYQRIDHQHAAGSRYESFPGFGLLAQPSNVGAYERDEFSVIPEIGVTARVLRHRSVAADRRIHAAVLDERRSAGRPDRLRRQQRVSRSAGANPAASILKRPLFAFDDTDIWAQGLQLRPRLSVVADALLRSSTLSPRWRRSDGDSGAFAPASAGAGAPLWQTLPATASLSDSVGRTVR